MMKKIEMAFCLWVIVLTSCTVASPGTIMQAGIDKLSNADSSSYSLDVTIAKGQSVVEITGTGQYKSPNQSYLQLNSVGTNFEILSLSNNKLYLKDPFSGTWHTIPVGDLTLSGFASDYYSQQLVFLKVYDQSRNAGSEIIDGVDCAHFKFVIPPDKLPQGFLKTILLGVNDLTNLSITGDMWAGKSDSLPRKSLVQLAIGKDFQFSTTIFYHEFNTPLIFPAP